MTNKILLLFLFLISMSKIFSQEIENVDMRVENNIVIITYDLLNVPNKTLCNMSVKIINESGEVIKPKTLTGDVYDVAEGKIKTIKWDVFADGNELKGRYKASVEINKILNKEAPKVIEGTEIELAENAKDKDKFLSDLAKKYPPGVTEEIINQSNRKIIRRVVVKDNIANEYTRVIYSFGTYYFKNGNAINQGVWNADTK